MEVLSKCGGFDEQFFMYAEDLDLSSRIRSAGYDNYYLSSAGIVHFKGESTIKDKYYIKTFYQAMSRFSKKYAPERFGSLYKFFIESGIQFRMFLALILNKQPEKADSLSEKLLLIGDEKSKKELAEKIKIMRSPEVSGEEYQIVFCEGENYSYKQMIEDMQGKYAGKTFNFYALGSSAIIQSGTAELLYP